MTITYLAWHKITSRMFTRHYDVNDATKRAKLTLWKHVTWVYCKHYIFQLQTKNIPSKYAESKFDAKQLGKKLCLRPEGWRIGIN